MLFEIAGGRKSREPGTNDDNVNRTASASHGYDTSGTIPISEKSV